MGNTQNSIINNLESHPLKNNMKKYKVYLFDFDGTLFNTLPSLYNVFKKSFEACGLTYDESKWERLTRIRLNDGFIEYGGKMEDFPKYCQMINKVLNTKETTELTETYDDTLELMEKLHNESIISGIVTSNNVPHVQDVLSFYKIPLDTFDIYIGNQQFKNHKPDPEPIIKALESINYKGELNDVIYIGDAYNDCLCAINAGVDCYLLDRTKEIKDCPYKIIHSLKEIFDE